MIFSATRTYLTISFSNINNNFFTKIITIFTTVLHTPLTYGKFIKTKKISI